MVYVKDVGKFVRENGSEFKLMVQKICSSYDISSRDVIQDLYVKFVEKKTLSNFDPNYPNKPKFSTYLYKVALNAVKAHTYSKENYIERHRYNPECYDVTHGNVEEPSYEEIDYSFDHTDINYQMDLRPNCVSDDIDGINLDLDLFETYLVKRNKVYKLGRRRDKNVVTPNGLSLVYLFKLMRMGYTNKEIAQKFGVSVAFITTLSRDLMDIMKEFGILWDELK